ncbi:formylglycine-generating enzyme family protein [Herbiconiux moechotypicola]|uniref:Formylglycine-generating enzyme family protein n=1 Tax=Herbiconiux moechotypicola TaxID=637393 RepID=A0ABN3DZV9_9MICO|nr:formylglycine-generating enzyme family protein [Herbiconiux moechotypicola]MCS5731239.1 formylglycine-generating enzyme family protein [Herbiconiux moechotypicola]
MIRIEGGRFSMGSDEYYPDEAPVHERTIESFWIEEYAVTNSRFAEFVQDTGYVTVAERPLDPADFPGASPADLLPGGMVFTQTAGPVDLSEFRHWWTWVPGASWRTPLGPGSSLEGRGEHPVVQVAFEDASAFAEWAGGRLPSEAEHEYAALGGTSGRRFAWGDDPYPDAAPRANTWIGRFPYDNRGRFGADTAPVGSFPANGYGLFDMIGNVWEWTGDHYSPRHVVPGVVVPDAGSRVNLLGTDGPVPGAPARRVLKGGSYLCSPDYCLRFRPAARSPQTEDSASTHIGFRVARDA